MRKYEHYTESVFYQLEQTARYCKFLGLQLFKKLKLEITPDEFAALDVIMLNDGICQRDLAKLLLKDRPNTGRILNSLENFGYVERSTDKRNNRTVKKMKLTSLGKKRTLEISKVLKIYLGDVSNIFPEEKREALIELVTSFRCSLKSQVEIKI